MKNALIVIAAFLFMVLLAQAQAPSVVPTAPQMTSDALFASMGRCTAERDLQAQYVNQLQQKILALNQELEDLKKSAAPAKTETKPKGQ